MNRAAAPTQTWRIISIAIALACMVCVALSVAFPREELWLQIGGDVTSARIYEFTQGYSKADSSLRRVEYQLDGAKPIRVFRLVAPIESNRFRFDPKNGAWLTGQLTVRRVQRNLLFDQYWSGQRADVIKRNKLQRQGNRWRVDLAQNSFIDFRVGVNDAAPTRYWHGDWLFLPIVLLLLWLAGRQFVALIRGAPDRQWFALLCVLWLAILLSFAWQLPFNHGPDEGMHYLSGSWYFRHWLPPLLGSEAYVSPTWGFSYTAGHADLTYLASFKLAKLWFYFSDVPAYSLVRIAQPVWVVLLLLALLRYVGLAAAGSLLLIVLAIPQLLYTGTYINGDFLSVLFAYLGLILVMRNPQQLLGWVFIAMLLVINSKQNYWLVALPVAFFYLKHRSFRLRNIMSDLPWLALSLALAGYRFAIIAVDQWVSGTTYLADRIERTNSERIRQIFLDQQAGRMNWGILTEWRWYQTSLQSFLGKLGQMKHALAPWQYATAGGVMAALLWFAGRRGAMAALGLFALNTGLSLYNSMSYAYQAQGRYLFPALLVLVALASERLWASRGWFVLLIIPVVLALAEFAR